MPCALGTGRFTPGGKIKDDSNIRVDSKSISHPGGCVSYKFTEHSEEGSKDKRKIIVVSTDFEPDFNGTDNQLVEWWQDADLVIADGQYEADSKQNPFMKGGGHSDSFIDLELARRAGVKHLVITHFDPKSDDAYLRDLELRVQLSAHAGLKVDFAREGQEFEI